MKVTLDKEAIKIAYAAADPKVEMRVVLQYVSIGNGEIVAADGYMLARRTIPIEAQDGETILVNAKAILQAHKLLKGDYLIIETNEDGKTALITSDAKRTDTLSISISTNLLDAKYPAYTHIVPKTKRLAYVALQANLIVKILKTSSADGNVAVKLKVRTPTDPVEIHVNETDIYIMPYFVPEESG